MKIAFNTGAYYTVHGQRIGAWIEVQGNGSGVCCFVDFDRDIGSHFAVGYSSSLSTPQEWAHHVMYMYDHGQYGMPYIEGMHGKLRDVANNGYDAFISDPAVSVIAYRR